MIQNVRESIHSRIFSYNKAQGKNRAEPNFIDVEEKTDEAMQRLEDVLVDLALENTEF